MSSARFHLFTLVSVEEALLFLSFSCCTSVVEAPRILYSFFIFLVAFAGNFSILPLSAVLSSLPCTGLCFLCLRGHRNPGNRCISAFLSYNAGLLARSICFCLWECHLFQSQFPAHDFQVLAL